MSVTAGKTLRTAARMSGMPSTTAESGTRSRIEQIAVKMSATGKKMSMIGVRMCVMPIMAQAKADMANAGATETAHAAGNVADVDLLKETELIEKARSGDTESFSALVELHQERAIHAANALVGNLEDARDLAQEAFVKAYENLDRFESKSRFYTWLYRILANTCKDFLRKKKLRRTFSFWFGNEEEGEADPVSRIPDRSRNAAEDLENRELGFTVQNALATLPFRQKLVFTLRYMEGLTLDDIASSLDITVGAVKANLWQAGQKMQFLLKEEYHGR